MAQADTSVNIYPVTISKSGRKRRDLRRAHFYAQQYNCCDTLLRVLAAFRRDAAENRIQLRWLQNNGRNDERKPQKSLHELRIKGSMTVEGVEAFIRELVERQPMVLGDDVAPTMLNIEQFVTRCKQRDWIVQSERTGRFYFAIGLGYL